MRHNMKVRVSLSSCRIIANRARVQFRPFLLLHLLCRNLAAILMLKDKEENRGWCKYPKTRFVTKISYFANTLAWHINNSAAVLQMAIVKTQILMSIRVQNSLPIPWRKTTETYCVCKTPLPFGWQLTSFIQLPLVNITGGMREWHLNRQLQLRRHLAVVVSRILTSMWSSFGFDKSDEIAVCFRWWMDGF